jgi:hypothetical protein
MEDAAIYDRATDTTTYRIENRILSRADALAYLHSRAMSPAAARAKLQELPVEDSESQSPK